jgi:hypothetical protein
MEEKRWFLQEPHNVTSPKWAFFSGVLDYSNLFRRFTELLQQLWKSEEDDFAAKGIL